MKRALLYLFAFLAVEFVVQGLAGLVYTLVDGSQESMPSRIVAMSWLKSIFT